MRAAIDAFFFEIDALDDIAQRHCAEYPVADPYPHVVLHDLVPREALHAVIIEFPDVEAAPDAIKDNAHTRKKRSYRRPTTLGPHTRQLLSELNGSVFLDFLERLTGIKGLIPDPHFSGGGLHQIQRGGFLNIHADFNRLDRLGLYRRINLLLYLNEDWDDAWGGHLELWSRDMSSCVERIAPTLGTCVIFNTSDHAFHGHPDPLECPPARARNSIALYYYSSDGSSREAARDGSTLWQPRPDTDDRAAGSARIRPAVTNALRRIRSRLSPPA